VAFFFVGALTAVADLAPPPRRGEAMSLASLSLYVGIGMGPLLGAARATRVALALSAAGLAVVGAWRTPAGLVAGTAIFATGIALLTPAVMTLAVQGVAPQERGAVIGTTSAFLDLAVGLGPATLGPCRRRGWPTGHIPRGSRHGRRGSAPGVDAAQQPLRPRG
jgi:predicted MFS family arabinose efflux permease